MSKTKRLISNFFLLVVGVIVAFAISELVLALCYSKQIRVIGNEIVLATNQDYKFSNLKNSKLDKNIIHSKNSIGFRGEELDESASLKIITVGGSSTECFYLNKEDDWSLLLGQFLREDGFNNWVNNAGFSGHSTFGHLKLLQDHIVHLHPDIVLFNIGVNDLSLLRASHSDEIMLLQNQSLLWKLMSKSRTITLVKNIFSSQHLGQYYISSTFNPVDLAVLDSIYIPPTDEGFLVSFNHRYNYAQRIAELIDICRSNDIQPIFIAQPTLYACGYDVDSTIHIGSLKMSHTNDVNGCILYKSLRVYRNVLKKATEENHCPMIDMDDLFPKNVDYYYDFVHFSKEGSNAFAKMLYEELKPMIECN